MLSPKGGGGLQAPLGVKSQDGRKAGQKGIPSAGQGTAKTAAARPERKGHTVHDSETVRVGRQAALAPRCTPGNSRWRLRTSPSRSRQTRETHTMLETEGGSKAQDLFCHSCNAKFPSECKAAPRTATSTHTRCVCVGLDVALGWDGSKTKRVCRGGMFARRAPGALLFY